MRKIHTKNKISVGRGEQSKIAPQKDTAGRPVARQSPTASPKGSSIDENPKSSQADSPDNPPSDRREKRRPKEKMSKNTFIRMFDKNTAAKNTVPDWQVSIMDKGTGVVNVFGQVAVQPNNDDDNSGRRRS